MICHIIADEFDIQASDMHCAVHLNFEGDFIHSSFNQILAHTRALRRINVFLNIILKSLIEVIIEIIKLIAIQLKTSEKICTIIKLLKRSSNV